MTPVGSWQCARPFRVLACVVFDFQPILSYPALRFSKFSFLPLKCCLLRQHKYTLFFYQYITMPLTPFISSIMELTMTRVCITTQKSLELFGKNKKNEKKCWCRLLLCVLAIIRSCHWRSAASLRSSKAFTLTKWKSDIWKVKHLKRPSLFFFFNGEMSVSTQLCEEHQYPLRKSKHTTCRYL